MSTHNPEAAESSLPGVGQWIESARDGNQSSWQHLHERFHRYLLLIAQRETDVWLRPKIAPSDLVQETLCSAQQEFLGFRGDTDSQLRAWLRVILINKLQSARRRYGPGGKRDMRRERTMEAGLAEAHGIESLVDLETPSKCAVRAERNSHLLSALDALPADYRLAVTMRSLDRRSYAEIGAALGRSEDAARQLWLRALKRLATELRIRNEIG